MVKYGIMSAIPNVEVIGYRYTPPQNPNLHALPEPWFEVVSSTEYGTSGLARTHQEIFHEALSHQYATRLPQAYIDRIANPADEQLVDEEAYSLELAQAIGTPVHLHARFPVPALLSPSRSWYVAGIGSSHLHDERSLLRQVRAARADRPEPGLYADIGDIHVRPSFESQDGVGNGPVLQGRGIGTALLHGLLGNYHPDIPTYVEEYPLENPDIVPILKKWGFKRISDKHTQLAGVTVIRSSYLGPVVGELTEELERRHPWLGERDVVTPA